METPTPDIAETPAWPGSLDLGTWPFQSSTLLGSSSVEFRLPPLSRSTGPSVHLWLPRPGKRRGGRSRPPRDPLGANPSQQGQRGTSAGVTARIARREWSPDRSQLPPKERGVRGDAALTKPISRRHCRPNRNICRSDRCVIEREREVLSSPELLERKRLRHFVSDAAPDALAVVLIGSFARGTAVRPMSDLDVLAVTDGVLEQRSSEWSSRCSTSGSGDWWRPRRRRRPGVSRLTGGAVARVVPYDAGCDRARPCRRRRAVARRV